MADFNQLCVGNLWESFESGLCPTGQTCVKSAEQHRKQPLHYYDRTQQPPAPRQLSPPSSPYPAHRFTADARVLEAGSWSCGWQLHLKWQGGNEACMWGVAEDIYPLLVLLLLLLIFHLLFLLIDPVKICNAVIVERYSIVERPFSMGCLKVTFSCVL